MANTTFAGAIAEQEYQWEYTCEFCGKRVEKTGKLTASHGFGRNVNTRWSVNRAWSQEAIAQAERKLAEKKAQTESLSQSGQWAPVGDDGKCPYSGNTSTGRGLPGKPLSPGKHQTSKWTGSVQPGAPSGICPATIYTLACRPCCSWVC